MIHRSNAAERLLIRSMGKNLRVTAIATTDDEANEYLRRHKDEAVIACFGPFVLMANKYDKGL